MKIGNTDSLSRLKYSSKLKLFIKKKTLCALCLCCYSNALYNTHTHTLTNAYLSKA